MDGIMTVVDVLSGIEDFKDRYHEASENVNLATSFWNTYNPNPIELLMGQKYHELRERMFRLLRTCKKIDQTAYDKIHKGHPYFFIGITSYRLGDYQTAISFFDAALSEELKIQDGEIRQTQMFFLLMGEQLNNAARQETLYVQTKVERSIDHYNNVISKNQDIPQITIQDLRDIFINYILNKKDDPGLRTLLTAFLTFIVEWDSRNEHFDLGVREGTSEPLFQHLFRGCVLFESLLKRNPHPKPNHDDQKKNLGKLITFYQDEIKVKLPGNFSSKKTGISELGDLLTLLKNQTTSIENSVLISFWLRNILGHSLAWEDRIDQVSYHNLYFQVTTACLHVINTLWRPPIATHLEFK